LLLHGGIRDAPNLISVNKVARNMEFGIETRSDYNLIERNIIASNGMASCSPRRLMLRIINS